MHILVPPVNTNSWILFPLYLIVRQTIASGTKGQMQKIFPSCRKFLRHFSAEKTLILYPIYVFQVAF